VELRQLRYFVAVAEERHFGRAASRLRIATPSLSQQIRALERDLHAVLLDRGSHGVALTPAGEALLGHARGLLTRAQRARDDVRSATGRPRSLAIRVATGAEPVFGDLLRDFLTRCPELLVSVATTHGVDAVHAVRDERADAAVVWGGADGETTLARATLREIPVHLALPAGHRLALGGAGAVPVGELADETLVLFPRDLAPGVWDRVVGHLLPGTGARHGQVVAEPDPLGGPATMPAAVVAGHAIGVVAPALRRRTGVAGIVVRPLDPPLTLPLELVWREPADPALRQLLTLAGTPEP
jgi:DNA-binding transcriptional LysR family regulator